MKERGCERMPGNEIDDQTQSGRMDSDSCCLELYLVRILEAQVERYSDWLV